MTKDNNKKPKFLRVYANIPEPLRNDIIVVIEKKPYTRNTAFLEIRDNTKLGEEILKTLDEFGII